ncbi:hypothetical protein IA69_00475 [Massilia sp. JS1662]|nr:hypothetical protein [Massilia sp. JS1662]KGF83325.1 hypothetical protein IA69_00475 [Massilia sp. JS1662]
MKKYIKIVLFAAALAIPVRALCSAAWVNRAFVGAGDYVQIDDGVYAARDLPPGERRRALTALRAARGRIAGTFGVPVARPTTIIAADDREAARFGLADDVPGTAFISPLRTEVVLNLAHFSIDVTAHELVHAELAQRLGFWTRAVKLPVWFDEGVAVQLDRREPYMIDCGAVGEQRVRAVRQLTTVRRFWHGDRGQIVQNYQAARCAAAEVLERHPPDTLYTSLARLARGADFDDVFGPGPTTP